MVSRSLPELVDRYSCCRVGVQCALWVYACVCVVIASQFSRLAVRIAAIHRGCISGGVRAPATVAFNLVGRQAQFAIRVLLTSSPECVRELVSSSPHMSVSPSTVLCSQANYSIPRRRRRRRHRRRHRQ